MDKETHSKDAYWQIEHLISKAFVRTKNRLVSYMLSLIIGIGLYIAGFIIAAIIAGIAFAIASFAKILFLTIVIGLVAGVTIIILFFYINAWLALTQAHIIIQKTNHGVIQAFKDTKKYAKKFTHFLILAALFMIGLLPLGIVSAGLVLFIWSLWGTFAIFVYLKHRYQGLDNLWVSRQMINTRFWGIVGRLTLLHALFWFLGIILLRNESVWAIGSSVALSLFSAPFMISFTYELFGNISGTFTPQKPRVWVILAILGWILIVIGVSAVANIRQFHPRQDFYQAKPLQKGRFT